MQDTEATTVESVRHRATDRLMLAEVSRGLFGTTGSIATRVGRFVVLDEIGAGGMGTVFRGYDPDLDRRLAVKVLQPGAAADVSASTRRLRLEAVALARLNHPNVVTVHEVGAVGDDVFLAMEFVDGGDLRRWAAEHPVDGFTEDTERHRTALNYLHQAGRGLAAAHDADLVHRDFKPSNVLVGVDGRVRVADFGLAQTSGADSWPSATQQGLGDARLTATGAIAGTPRYMAPEQSADGAVDARTDQFAFCTTAWEVLFGVLPPRGATPQRARAEAPSGASARLVGALRRGLSVDPNDRFASMSELLNALPDGQPSRSRASVLGAVAILGVGTAALASALFGAEPCADVAQRLHGVWDVAREAEVKAALSRSDAPYADKTWSELQTTLGAYAAAWTSAATDVCEATQVRREQSASMMDAKMSCLAHRRRALGAFVTLMAEGSSEALGRAALGMKALPSVDWCLEDDHALQGFDTPGEADAARVAQVREVLAASATLRDSGQAGRAFEALSSVAAAVPQLAYPPVTQDYALELARVKGALGQWREARHGLLEAYAGAARTGRPFVAAEAASRLAVALVSGGDAAGGRRFIAIAESALADGAPASLRTAIVRRRADVAFKAGDLEDAQAGYVRALELIESENGQHDPQLILVLRNLGSVTAEMGQLEEAGAYYRSALALSRALGESHPTSADVLVVRAGLALEREDARAAEADAAEAVTIMQVTYGVGHPKVASASTALAMAKAAQGQLGDAIEVLEEAVAAFEAAADPEHWDAHAYAESALGEALADAGRVDEGAPHAEKSLDLLRASAPTGDASVAAGIHDLAFMRIRQGRDEEALRLAEEARDLFLRRFGPDHPALAASVGQVGSILLNLERWSESASAMQRQLDILERSGEVPTAAAQPLYNLGWCFENLGDLEQAESYYARSREVLALDAAPNEPTLAYPLLGLARTTLAAGRSTEAVAVARRALALVAEGPAQLKADAQSILARALWASGTDRARARALAVEAAEGFVAIGAAASTNLAAHNEWRRANGL